MPVSEPARLPHLHDHAAPLPLALRGTVMLLGNFDGLHRGHQALLDRARAIARAEARPLSIMACEPHPKRFFAPHLAPFRLSCGAARYAALAEAGLTMIWSPKFDAGFAGLAPRDFIETFLMRELGVAHIVVGEDFRFGARRGGDVALLAAEAERCGYYLDVVCDVTHDGQRVSSSAVRAAIGAGDMAQAAALLGRPWQAPVSCRGIGRYGVADEQLLPPPGHYTAQALCHRGRRLETLEIELTTARQILAPLPAEAASLGF